MWLIFVHISTKTFWPVVCYFSLITIIALCLRYREEQIVAFIRCMETIYLYKIVGVGQRTKLNVDRLFLPSTLVDFLPYIYYVLCPIKLSAWLTFPRFFLDICTYIPTSCTVFTFYPNLKKSLFWNRIRDKLYPSGK